MIFKGSEPKIVRSASLNMRWCEASREELIGMLSILFSSMDRKNQDLEVRSNSD